MRSTRAASRYLAIKRRAKKLGYETAIVLYDSTLQSGDLTRMTLVAAPGRTLGDDLADTEAVLDKFEANPGLALRHKLNAALGLPAPEELTGTPQA